MNKMAAGLVRALVAPALALMAQAPGAQAQTADAFYKGKQIRFIVGTAAGQDYDSWSRLIGRHMTRFIPGNPTFVVENMPGAGHILATNYLFNLAPRDGTVIGMVSRNITEAYMMKLPNVRFDPGKFNWIGSPELNHRVLFVNAASGFDKVADLYQRELIIGAPGGAQGGGQPDEQGRVRAAQVRGREDRSQGGDGSVDQSHQGGLDDPQQHVPLVELAQDRGALNH